MQTPTKNPKYRGTTRLRELAALTLLLASMALISACGGGGGEGDNSGGGGNAEEQGNGEQAAGEAGGANGGGTTAASKKDAPPITDVRSIFVNLDKNVLNGSRARLKDVEVRTIVSERAFFIGENDAEKVLVLNVGDPVEVSEGQKVLVAGRLNVPRPNLEEKLSLTPEEATAVNDQDIFLRAPRVEPQEG